MFDRLKMLPLTILLTVLIWMYAEAQVNSTRAEATLFVQGVPVTLNGPPGMLAQILGRCDVIFEPADVSVQVEGAPDRIDALRQRASAGGGRVSDGGIRAYVDVTNDDQALAGGGLVLSRTLRVVADDFVVVQAPERVTIRVVVKHAETAGK